MRLLDRFWCWLGLHDDAVSISVAPANHEFRFEQMLVKSVCRTCGHTEEHVIVDGVPDEKF